MLASRLASVVGPGSLVLPALLLACGPQVELETDTDATTGDSTGPEPTTTAPTTTVSTTVGTDPTDPDGGTEGPVPTERAVDILFVVDNSGSMSEEQAMLSLAIASLIEALDTAEPPVDYHIGVTTTDNGNPWCGTTSPEAGNLRLTSCRSRPTEFTFNGATVIEAFEDACAAICPEEWTNIEIRPTAVDGQNGDAPRPWIESSAGETNLPDGLSTVQAFQCFGPQGIDGCGFEQPLESMWKAIRRSVDENEDEFGFHRDGALLAVAFVTDEEDCSYHTDWETIFLPEGNRVFWSDPMAASPTSAVCWHAGVACTGSGTPYDTCDPVNLDVDGNEVAPTSADEDAVLRPVARYTDILTEAGAYVFALDGVNASGNAVYSLDTDPSWQNDFGIAPGCEAPSGRAVPPVRMREVVDTTSGLGNHSSVCAAAYDDGLSTFAQGILSRLP